jgi:FkbM family methyltransferase
MVNTVKLDQKEIKKLLRIEDPLILEIGAHKGVDTQRFLNEFKKIRIFCFEPDPRCINEFKKYIKDKRCTLIEAAVSDTDGKTILHLSGGYNPGKFARLYRLLKSFGLIKYFQQKEEWDFSSTINKNPISNSNKYPWLDFKKEFEVQTIRLDTWVRLNNIPCIDFIWSDVQGGERKMVEGAQDTLRIVKYFFIEYGETEVYPEAMTREETIQLFKKYSFELEDKYSSNTKRGNLLFKNKNL